MNNRQVGSMYEEMAVTYLQNKGYIIIDTNYRCKAGEVDIVAKDGNYLVFVEVKYRKNNRMGNPEEAVDARKQHKITKTAQWYIMEKHLEDVFVRFDVVAILDREITLIKDAF